MKHNNRMPVIIQKIEQKLQIPNLVSKLTDHLSGSEFGSLLLGVFRKRVAQISPPELLRLAAQNRFTQPAPLDPIRYKKEEILWLSTAADLGFIPIQLSPLSPFGSCSVFGYVDQNNVVSASRSSEVVADATNMLAIQIATQFKQHDADPLKYCASHRHVRAQHFENPGFFAHFSVFCMASGGNTSNHPSLETDFLLEHLGFYSEMLGRTFSLEHVSLEILLQHKNPYLTKLISDFINTSYPAIRLTFRDRDPNNKYYQTLQFRFNIDHAGRSENLADGGFVDWTQRMLSNKKHRLLISGIGLERLLGISG